MLLFILLSTGCMHRPLSVSEEYFQAMGDAEEVVLTIDMRSAQAMLGKPASPDPALTKLIDRIDRISLTFYDEEQVNGEPAVIDVAKLFSYAFYGGVEGDIPAFLVNTAMLWSKEWEQIEKDERRRYYHNEQLGIDAYAPKNGLLLFASDDYWKAYETTWKNRRNKIPDDLAQRMAHGLFSLYIATPKTMIDIGLTIPPTVLQQARSLLVVLEEEEQGEISMGGVITMNSPKLANSLSILLKSSYISDKRRNKEPLGDVTNLFVLRDDQVVITGMDLSEHQYEAFTALFYSLFSMRQGEVR